ncbi:hypothetical protein [Pyxidicoccus xibeiensis]|uniref:hypothetical protein n=1 Tax=Pyxidicoccus xibeiensis TaxID=2906759 RepID=UPI0020A7E192|nr:hypothetical protein [Pyxidicoccus xibeiensis]MCP3144691.1 hypothetical protein [Pyxidicoccus xibeiensis]
MLDWRVVARAARGIGRLPCPKVSGGTSAWGWWVARIVSKDCEEALERAGVMV